MAVNLLADKKPLTYTEFDKNFTDLYPIGTVICTTAHSTAGAWQTALGFGTWEVYSAQRSIVGVDAEGSTTANSTGPYRQPGVTFTGTAQNNRSITSARATSATQIELSLNSLSNRANEEFSVGQKITTSGLTGGSNPNGTFTISDVNSNNTSISITVSGETSGTEYGTTNARYDLFTAEETGGSTEHTLTISEMPRHDHQIVNGNSQFAKVKAVDQQYGGFFGNTKEPGSTVGSGGGNDYETSSVGNDEAHNNLMPYKVVYMYKRTA